MPQIQLFETIVTPSVDGSIVQLYISNSPRDAEDGAIRIALTALIPAYNIPLLAHVQRAAIAQALKALQAVHNELGFELEKNGRSLDAGLK